MAFLVAPRFWDILRLKRKVRVVAFVFVQSSAQARQENT